MLNPTLSELSFVQFAQVGRNRCAPQVQEVAGSETKTPGLRAMSDQTVNMVESPMEHH